MSGTRVTIELSDELHERIAEASRRAGSSLNATILRLIEHALAERVSDRDQVPAGAIFDPDQAARRRRDLPVLDPPLSRTVIEGREDRI